MAICPFHLFAAIVTGDCRWQSEWSNDPRKDGSQECNKEEVMVGIKKTYFNDESDDDWKYKIRCCKVISFVGRGEKFRMTNLDS